MLNSRLPARARAECRRPHFETSFAQDTERVLWQRALNKLAAKCPEFVSRLHLCASLSRVDPIFRSPLPCNTPGTSGRWCFGKIPMQTFLVQRAGVGRTKLFSDLLHREDDDPYIPGTTVRRMQTVRLGPKAIGVLDTEVQRVTSELTKAPPNRKVP